MSYKLITRDVLRQKNLERRQHQLEEALKQNPNNRMARAMLLEAENGQFPKSPFAEGFKLENHFKKVAVGEYITTDAVAAQFIERQRYEVETGRDEEPLIYPMIYNVVTDESLPKTIDIYTLGPAGVVMEEVFEGGEVKFASIGQGSKTVTMRHFAVGLEYSEDIFMYNQLWRLPNLERQFGIAHSARLNHSHMLPILDFNYTADNQTDGTALETFRNDASMPEKYLRTIEQAIVNATTDTDNPRRGPYALLVSSADVFTVERALNRVAQQGFDLQSSAIGRIQTVIAYDGWTGTRGALETSYAGVEAGTAYLIDLSFRDMDFQSYFKHGLRRQVAQPDLKRFILGANIWDVRFGVFADPERAVEEITFPGVNDGFGPEA